MIRNIINVTGSSVTITDMNGLVIDAGATANGLAFDENTLINSASLIIHILNGDLQINDGIQTYIKMDAVNFLKGLSTQFTKDGKQITTSSDRPAGFYRHFTGNGDDVTSNPKKIGAGPHIHLIAEAGQTATIDIHFADDVYIRDGEVRYLNAGFDSHLSIEVYCPPNTPFPHPTHQGTLDLTATGFVPNTTNTGAYMTAPVEVKLFRFINQMHLVGSDNLNSIQSPEPFMMVYPYFLRYTLEADPDITGGPLKAAITMGMYRKKTI
jgi:hypothetical protein